MSTPAITTDHYDNRYAAVAVEELDEWAWLLGRLEDWLSQAQPDTAADWAHFSGPCGADLDQIVYVLGHWAVRMRNLAEGRP
ncbi:MAG: hypothetical protein M3378_09935 [Actinomycetota bacterium]|nr:hypothetical protein [Actinomycetota bacterium]MDQ3680840.1 hypothetical protein [Actinomycetota bacterium]